MKKLTFILALSMLCVLGKAADVTLPVDYNTIFATSATGSGVLEKGSTATLSQWFKGTLSSYTNGTNPTIQASTLGYANYVDNYASNEIVYGSTSARLSAFELSETGYAIGTYYASALIKIAAVPTSTSSALVLSFDKALGSGARGRMYVRGGATAGFNFGISTNAGGTAGVNCVYGATEYSLNTTYLVVIKYTFVTNTSIDASLFVNPVPGDAEPAATITAGQYADATAALKSFNVIQTSTTLGSKVAGIRIGTSWTDVVKNGGKLTKPVLVSVDNISSSGFTAKWIPVASATGYDVYVYQEGVQVGSTQNVLGQTASSLEITGLSGNTTYTYKVVAKGVGNSSLDSDISEASAEVSTLTTEISNQISISNYVTVIGKNLTTINKGTIEIYNLQGSRVFNVQNTNNVNTNLASGLYIVSFTNKAGKQFIQKITIL